MDRQEDLYIPRRIENTLKQAIDSFPAVAITGPRQSGKSTLVKKIFAKTHTLASFDDPLLRQRAIFDPRLFIENLGEWIVLDEIQYVPEILSYIKILIDQKRHNYGRFIIIGSQQFHLIKNLGDTLAGRVALFDLLPFSLEEKRDVSWLKAVLSDTQESFLHACLEGSYPEKVIHPGLNFHQWYSSYVQTYLERDIRTIYDIGILREFQQFMRLLAGRCSQILNLSSLAGDLGISGNTIKRWLSILEASRIIYLLPPYYRNLGKRITKSPKVYFLDLGLVCYLTGLETKEHLLNGPLAGALFENFVIQETVKYYCNRGIIPSLFYLRTHNKVEIDLIIEKRLELYPFEIKLNKTPNSKMAQPIEQFMNIFSQLNIKRGKIISLADSDSVLTKFADSISFNTYLAGL